jgi:EpsI family protein
VLPQRAEALPTRQSFTLFPNNIGSWTGKRSSLDAVYLDALKLDDYVIADYRRPGEQSVNFYVAWYNSQRSGQSAHSPRSCLPGGGWRIDSLTQVAIPAPAAGNALNVNRMLISQGDQRQLMYYWFQQRGRAVTSEYLVKWYLFWDALTRNRTDGALVRLIVPLGRGTEIAAAETTLNEFAAGIADSLPRFIPN